MKNLLIAMLCFLAAFPVWAQENYKTISKEDSVKIYIGKTTYEVKTYTEKHKADKPKNIIFMIGDGMGVSAVHAGLTANGGQLFLNNFKQLGFITTNSASDYVTDSAAGGTALSSGYKTYNGAIGVDTDTVAQPSVLEKAEAKGLATGLVSSSAITHATPASFIAHQPSRNHYEAIAGDFLKTDIDVFIGGGYKHFTDRKDGRNLTTELEGKGYTVLQDMNKIDQFKSGKLAGLTAPEHNPRVDERGDMLPRATGKAIELLSQSKKGFFLMVEGSQIDWAGHQNNTIYLVEEVLDFDRCIAKALEFASKDRETLVVVTADHETGGLGINNGAYDKKRVNGEFTTGGHTGVMVPVFAFGPGAEHFTGIMDNTDIPKKMMELLGL
ncbi:alkaline phosphatase [Sunxiuqinia dokdonensis]|uniref:Alkaline phosphatase n=1 Tax=Sunxiuqinia dokdonensis TaxID=1409788 RepID=A0A0L8V7G8_9BACT|nr:alkaline phosphatase [Sunxiuqinia dokdonensis]KOH44293.1 alkaline phosphatase [Sunxiuqinia dokdonensis]